MRKINLLQVLILSLCLALTGFLVYVKPTSHPPVYDKTLDQQLLSLGDWQSIRANQLSTAVIDALLLDDFVFRTYGKDGYEVTLYIGYYYTGGKVGAAHDPQVCYPGQGWKLSDKEVSRMALSDGFIIDYASIKAELENRSEQIFYWFQVNDRTTSDTFNQKVQLFRSKVLREGEINAFVRLSTPLGGVSQAEANNVLSSFVNDFYPVFVDYVARQK